MTGFAVEFLIRKPLDTQITTYTIQKCPGTLAFLARVIGSAADVDIVICCQTIIETFPKMSGPYWFDGPTTNQMTSEHTSDRGMTGGSHIVYVQSRFGSMESGIIGTRYRIFVIAFSGQDLSCA